MRVLTAALVVSWTLQKSLPPTSMKVADLV
jgi:hypothetical protein